MVNMYISRLLEKTMKEAVGTFPAVLITGPRQSGKTTLVRELLNKKYNYVSLDELDIRSFAVQDPRGFLERYGSPLIIDEIQNAPQILSYIKSKIDSDRKPGNWILTGSQQFPLMRNVSESLAGRVAVLTLLSFSQAEKSRNLRSDLKTADAYIEHLCAGSEKVKKKGTTGDWILQGGYPELFVNKKISRKIWFSSYIQTYIDRDVRGNISKRP